MRTIWFLTPGNGKWQGDDGEPGAVGSELAPGDAEMAGNGEPPAAEGDEQQNGGDVRRPRPSRTQPRVRLEPGESRPPRRSDAIAEAHFLHDLTSRGVMTRAEARCLIAVPANIEELLRAFAAECGRAGPPVLSAIKFRRRVMHEFERLTCSASPAGDRVLTGGCGDAAVASTREPGLDSNPPAGLSQMPTSGGAPR